MQAGMRVLILGCLTALSRAAIPTCVFPLSTVYTHLNHSAKLTCSFWSKKLNWTTPDNAIVSKNSDVLTLIPPIVTGYYTCSSRPCNQVFIVKDCPSTSVPVPYFHQKLLFLNCSLHGEAVSWFYNNTRFVTFKYSTNSASGELNSDILAQFLSTHSAYNNTLRLQTPFLPGIYRCLAGDCIQTFELFYHEPYPTFTEARSDHFEPSKKNFNTSVLIVVISFALVGCFFVFFCCLFHKSCRKNPLTLIPYTRPPTRATGLFYSESTSNLSSLA
ncbi:E3 CR1-alpha [simian adenovirus 55]|uniref:E3 CR1-alpha n=1 Tax=simian adenovirus 55 TaxID=2848082 RepID=A0A1L3INZ0_9ADEN|nr:E3 CR1-alpha [Simian mastadenovirus WIV19]APG53811.1 E3 CR1-alpha [Simian mastadenovirus WIV19]